MKATTPAAETKKKAVTFSDSMKKEDVSEAHNKAFSGLIGNE